MRDRQTEASASPQAFLSLDDFGSALCVAPHPDDEVFGAGGLLAIMAAAGKAVRVLILSRGERAGGDASDDMAARRIEESRSAAQVLGVGAPHALDWPDRGMRYGEPLVASIASVIDETCPELLLLPALSEPHPDHQAVALAGMAAARRSACVRSVLFYEVGAPMHANTFVDISGVAERKWQAMRQFVSQEAIQPYEQQARALATLRAFGRGPDCVAAEAFFRVEVSALRQHGAAAALPLWPMARMERGLANAPEQLPLVSVLVRSMNRPQLAEAIACVAAQTYSNLEVVVVNASGSVHPPVLYPPERMELRLLQPGRDEGRAPERCDRATAANLALRAARGELAIFLDEDDLIDPEHLERLVAALDHHASAVAAYSGVRVEGAGGRFVRNYDSPWSALRLQAINFLPIHAVLFRIDRVRAAGLGFDETLPALEDWQFWRDLSALGEFIHCPGVSALYRQTHGDSGIADPEHSNYWRRWHRLLLERSVARNGAEENAKLLAWHAIELDQAQCREDVLRAELAQQRQDRQREHEQAQAEQLAARGEATLARTELASARAEAQELGQALRALENQHAALQEQHAALLVRNTDLACAIDTQQRRLQELQDSRSWRYTMPLRAVAVWFRARFR